MKNLDKLNGLSLNLEANSSEGWFAQVDKM